MKPKFDGYAAQYDAWFMENDNLFQSELLLFKKALGVSFKEYVLDYRMKQAKEQIERTNRSMRDISSRVGYEDYFQFSKIFKKVLGVSPTEYRAGLRRTGKQSEK